MACRASPPTGWERDVVERSLGTLGCTQHARADSSWTWMDTYALRRASLCCPRTWRAANSRGGKVCRDFHALLPTLGARRQGRGRSLWRERPSWDSTRVGNVGGERAKDDTRGIALTVISYLLRKWCWPSLILGVVAAFYLLPSRRRRREGVVSEMEYPGRAAATTTQEGEARQGQRRSPPPPSVCLDAVA